MSVEFQTLKECIEAKKGAFIGVIIKQGDLTSGTSNPGTSSEKDYTYKRFTIQDATGDIELTAWNGDIEKFKVGNKYEFTGFWFKEYKNVIGLAVGKGGKNKLIGTTITDIPQEQTTLPEPNNNINENNIKDVKNIDFKKLADAAQAPQLPEIGPNLAVFSEEQCIQLLQIEKIVKETQSKFAPTEIQSGQKVGMHTKEIYRESKKFKFEKASEG